MKDYLVAYMAKEYGFSPEDAEQVAEKAIQKQVARNQGMYAQAGHDVGILMNG